MSILNVFRMSRNVGDYNSSPCAYFDTLKGTKKDLFGVTEADCRGNAVIVGGGGHVIMSSSQHVKLLRNIGNWAQKAIAWGIGTNDINALRPVYHPIDDYALIGIRDFGTPYTWVPCASCMSPLFDKSYEVTHPIVTYWHAAYGMSIKDFPAMTNIGTEFEDVIRFLASGDLVITNSYHGVYWATLLGKKVLLPSPYSNRFLYYRHRPTMVDPSEFEKGIPHAHRYPAALDECRQANIAFHDKVMNCLNA